MTTSPPIPTTGSNTTGTRGLVAVDKVGNKVRFYDPATLAEIRSLDGPEPCVHELAIAHDHKRAYVPLYGDGIYGNNRKPNDKVVVLDLERQEIADVIALGPGLLAPHGMVATANGKLWLVCDIPRKLVLLDPARREVEASWGVSNLELPLGLLCQTDSFLWFASHLIAQLPRYQEIHNACLAEYRVAHHIRSRHHPVAALARCIDETGDLELLPVLGDALEEAGCDNPDVLDHCRAAARPLRRSWLVDLILEMG